MSQTDNPIHQVLAIVQPTKDYALNLDKKLRAHLGLEGNQVFLVEEPEVVLSASQTAGSQQIELQNARLKLPGSVVERLCQEGGSRLALISRGKDLALKILTVKERPGSWAELFEIETALNLERVMRPNKEAGELLESLRQQATTMRLGHHPGEYLRGKEDFPAWHARRLLGVDDPLSGDSQDGLIRGWRESQREDGSWSQDLLITAKALKQLHTLGLPSSDPAVRGGVEWLLGRAQSIHNPGMFFLSNDLVAQQATIIENRRPGEAGRFRQLKRGEIERVCKVIPTAHDPCGPRIMWPTALVLEVLISLGYEQHPRLQAGLTMLRYGGWCECGYQEGTHQKSARTPLTVEEIDQLEAKWRLQFRYGGLSGMQDLEHLDGHELPRVAWQETPDGRRYTLRLPEHQLPCELITTLGLSQVKSPLLQRLARAHLWRFAGRQHPPEGDFSGGGQKHVTPYFYLDLFSRYEHPAARIALLRMLPWVVEYQNPDGSWGDDRIQGEATLAVSRMLVALRGDLPGRFLCA